MIYFPKNEKDFPTKCFQLSPNISTLLAPQTITRRSTSISISPAPTPMISRRGWGENNNNNLIINAPPIPQRLGGGWNEKRRAKVFEEKEVPKRKKKRARPIGASSGRVGLVIFLPVQKEKGFPPSDKKSNAFFSS